MVNTSRVRSKKINLPGNYVASALSHGYQQKYEKEIKEVKDLTKQKIKNQNKQRENRRIEHGYSGYR